MNTPIADFCRRYAEQDTARLHMPGHKGTGPLGVEAIDLTEIAGADSLYEADGIIAESERNAASLFGTRSTFYSCGGSSQSIKAMCLLAVRQFAKEHDGRAAILAGRNAHKSFVHASQLIGFDVAWLPSEEDVYSLCRCTITPEGLTKRLLLLREEQKLPAAVFVTSPDYLGNLLDIRGLAEASHAFGVPLLVDNAHGAYLKFLPEDRHPITLGADACADSAHKTLPVLTGGGYLHIGHNAPEDSEETARETMCMFGSTSPSYLILQSLDLCNAWLAESGSEAFAEAENRVSILKEVIASRGLRLMGEEPLKLTIDCAASGLGPGTDVAERFRDFGVECEYADRDTIVFMFSPQNTPQDYAKLERATRLLSPGMLGMHLPAAPLPEAVFQPYEVWQKPTEDLPVEDSVDRICADVRIGCPPAVLPVVPGERIDASIVPILRYYGIRTISVLK